MNADNSEFTECLKIKHLYHNVKYAQTNMNFYSSFKKTFVLSFSLYFGLLAFFQTILYLLIMNKDVNLMMPIYVMCGLSCFFIPFLAYLHFASFTHGLSHEITTKKLEGPFIASMQKNRLTGKTKKNITQEKPEKPSHKRL